MSDRCLSVGGVSDLVGVSRDLVYASINAMGRYEHRAGRRWKWEEVDHRVNSRGASDGHGSVSDGTDVQ